MPLKTINIGAAENDGTGTPNREAFRAINENFLYHQGDIDAVRASAVSAGNRADTAQTTANRGVADARLAHEAADNAEAKAGAADDKASTAVERLEALQSIATTGKASDVAVALATGLPAGTAQAVLHQLYRAAADFSGADDPAAIAGTTVFPFMTWADTSTGLLKRRNAVGDAWVAESVLFRRTVSVAAIGDLPTQDIGDIVVTGLGRHSWFKGRYAPNRFPTGYRNLAGAVSNTDGVTINIYTAGAWRDSTDSVDLVLPAPFSKVSHATNLWTPGSGGDAHFAARTNDTWYHLFAIRRDSDGVVDVGLDSSLTAANRPAGWTAYRRMASYRYGTSSFYPVLQAGNYFQYLTARTDVGSAGIGNLEITPVAVSVPPGLICRVHGVISIVGQVASLGVGYPGGTSFPTVLVGKADSVSAMGFSTLTDLNGRIAIKSNGGTFSSGLYVSIDGYFDFMRD